MDERCAKCARTLQGSDALYDTSGNIVCQQCALTVRSGLSSTARPPVDPNELIKKDQERGARRDLWRRRVEKLDYLLNFAAPLLIFVPAIVVWYALEYGNPGASSLWFQVGIPIFIVLSIFVIVFSSRALWRTALALGVVVVGLGVEVMHFSSDLGAGSNNPVETLFHFMEAGALSILLGMAVIVCLIAGSLVLAVMLLVRVARRRNG